MQRPVLPVLDALRCTGCGECVWVCAPGVLAVVDERLEFARPDRCDYCGECETVCGEEAISCPYDIVPGSQNPRRPRGDQC